MRSGLHMLILMLFLAVGFVSSMSAGDRANIRAMSMAGTSVASASGLDAVGVNPANLATYDRGNLAVSLLPIGIHVGSDFFDYGTYTQYFTGVATDSGRAGRYLTEQDKNAIIAGFANYVGRAVVDVEARLFGVSYCIKGLGGVAFTITDRVGAFADLPRDYVKFILNGNPIGSEYHFKDTKVQTSWIREYALTVGGKVPAAFLDDLNVGAAAKLVHGFGYYEIQRFNTSLLTDDHATLTGSVDFLSRSAGVDPTSVRRIGTYELFPDVAGKGFGIDVGVRGNANRFLSFGLSISDIGSINWRRNTTSKSADTTIVVDDPLNDSQRRTIENVVKGTTTPIGRFTTSLPTTFRMGVALQVDKLSAEDSSPSVLVELDYTQAFVETPYSTKNPRVSLGAEYRPIPWVVIRSGASFGGADYMGLALGAGVNTRYVDFEIGSGNVTWLLSPNSFSQGSVAVGTRIRL